jgi:hypothetical protein
VQKKKNEIKMYLTILISLVTGTASETGCNSCFTTKEISSNGEYIG